MFSSFWCTKIYSDGISTKYLPVALSNDHLSVIVEQMGCWQCEYCLHVRQVLTSYSLHWCMKYTQILQVSWYALCCIFRYSFYCIHVLRCPDHFWYVVQLLFRVFGKCGFLHFGRSCTNYHNTGKDTNTSTQMHMGKSNHMPICRQHCLSMTSTGLQSFAKMRLTDSTWMKSWRFRLLEIVSLFLRCPYPSIIFTPSQNLFECHYQLKNPIF